MKFSYCYIYIYIFLFLNINLYDFVKCDYKGIPEDRIFSMDALRKHFTIDIDKEFIIQVGGNPTTGYIWHLEKSSDDKNLLAINLNENKSCKDYEINEHPVGFTGVGGVYYFKFIGIKKGIYFLLFIYKRPWEDKNFKERRITIEIK